MRCFVAIDLPDEARAALEAVQDQLRVGRVSDPETLHLTLAFLGEQPDAALEEMHLALEAMRAAPFTLQLRGLGTFGGRSPRVLWAGVEPQPALRALHEKVRGAAHVAGIELPRERFRPHVTIARFGERLQPGELDKLTGFLSRFEQFPAPPFEVEEVVLFRSILHRDGAIHEPLEAYPLQP
jgi:2'-5' RNA ligase